MAVSDVYEPWERLVRIVVLGKVIDVPVEPNKHVKKGEVLFRLDPQPFEIQVRAARANVSQLKAKLLQKHNILNRINQKCQRASCWHFYLHTL